MTIKVTIMIECDEDEFVIVGNSNIIPPIEPTMDNISVSYEILEMVHTLVN